MTRTILEGWRLQLEQVPDLIDAVAEAAAAARVGDAVAPILEAAEEYFLDADDLLPDSLGILGLMDDMYLALSLLQSVSEQYRQPDRAPADRRRPGAFHPVGARAVQGQAVGRSGCVHPGRAVPPGDDFVDQGAVVAAQAARGEELDRHSHARPRRRARARVCRRGVGRDTIQPAGQHGSVIGRESGQRRDPVDRKPDGEGD